MSELGQKFITEVRQLAAEKPDFVYVSPYREGENEGSCVNVFEGKPSCLIGQAAWNIGVIDSSYENHDGNLGSIYTMVSYLKLVMDHSESLWLSRVQGYQDADCSWGEAVEKADVDMPW